MSIVLSHISALNYWLSHRLQAKSCQRVVNATTLISCPIKQSIESSTLLQTLEQPIHILVADACMRRRAQGVICHVWRHPLPDGTVFKTDEGFYVVSAELAFLQVARDFELTKLIKLGFSLCGTYAMSKEGIQSCEALTSVESLKSFVTKYSAVAGSRKVARALRYITENSASPMETVLTLLLCLPYALGGYGLPFPQLNHRINIKATKIFRASSRFYVCDLYWPQAQIAVEYDSDEFHVGADRIAYDSNKRSNLAAQGITVITVTWDQLKNTEKLLTIAHVVAKSCCKRLRFKQSNFMRTHLALRGSLFEHDGF